MTIAEIQEILKLAERLHQHSFEHIKGPLLKDHSYTTAFIQQLKKLPTTANDHDLAEAIFGERSLSSHYYFLKSHVTSMFLDVLLDRSVQKNIDSKLTQGIVEASRQYTIISLIERTGRRTIAKKLARRTYLLCKKYQLTALAIDLLELLRHFSVLDGDQKAYAQYSADLQSQLQTLQDTVKIQSIDHEIRIALSKHLIPELPFRLRLVHILTDIHTIASHHRENFTIRTTAYRLQYMCFQLEGDFQKSLRACKQAREFITSQPTFYSKARLGEFILYEFENQLLLRDFNKGMACIPLCEEYLSRGSNVWFKFKEYQYLFAMQTGRFELAKNVLQEVRTHERYQSQLTHLKERWDIYALYADYTSLLSEPQPLTTSARITKRKYKEIVHQFPTYTKDKRGYNVSILVLNILASLENRNYDAIIEQMESLSTYRTRYLRDTGVNQTAILFKMLRIMVKEDFDVANIRRKTKKLEQQFQLGKRSNFELTEGLQVLPAEWVWSRILAILQKNTTIQQKKL
jgi:hypothetical protein